MKQHSANAMYISSKLYDDGVKVTYPGLASHPQNALMKTMMK